MGKKSFVILSRRKKTYQIFIADIARVYSATIKKRPPLPNSEASHDQLTETEEINTIRKIEQNT
jgi:hypothetical protein